MDLATSALSASLSAGTAKAKIQGQETINPASLSPLSTSYKQFSFSQNFVKINNMIFSGTVTKTASDVLKYESEKRIKIWRNADTAVAMLPN
jgi:hypothetical protein